MTIEELQKRQAWSLDQKLDHTIGTIESFLTRTGHDCYVSFSGGKDSTVLLYIVRRWVDKNMLAVFLNTGNEYPENVRFVNTISNVKILRPRINMVQIVRQYGFPLVSKDVSEKVRQIKHSKSEKIRQIRINGYEGKNNHAGRCPKRWQFLANEKFDVSERCCDIMKKSVFKQFEQQTGLLPILGITAAESRLRTMQYIKRGGCNAFDGHRPASYPLSIWTDNDIYEMQKRYNIKFSAVYDDKRIRQTGCMICGFGADQNPEHWTYIAEHYPAAYRYYMNLQNNGVKYIDALRAVGANIPSM